MTLTGYAMAFVYLSLGLLALLGLWRWNTDPKYAQFNLVDLVAEDGKISGRKFMEFGAFCVCSVAFIMTVINGKVTAEWLGIYAGVFILGRVAGQTVHAYQNTRVFNAARFDEARDRAYATREPVRASLLRGDPLDE